MNKLYLKAAERIGIVEETKLEPTFEEGIKKVEAYRLAVDSALDGLEAMMQPNRLVVETGAIVAPPGQDPHEVMAAACTKLRQYVSSASQTRLEKIITAMNKLAESQRFSQTKGRAAVRRIRRFVTVDNQQMKDDMDKMKEGLELMDVARHEVKNSKTKDELEEKGMIYHKSVKAFNDQASKIQLVIDELPVTIFTNQREVVKFFIQREKYHSTATGILKELIEKIDKK
ncbi:unnamed protein product [Cylicocyclus nassatus]|uniref:BAR domain-containing protein n=1 Tax=Cylicocyclus nassatus TaxID=53992 RepID=A0AA36HAL2_CYLNA|nr:unnamed protein product [Cylicocyclus nassatus]